MIYHSKLYKLSPAPIANSEVAVYLRHGRLHHNAQQAVHFIFGEMVAAHASATNGTETNQMPAGRGARRGCSERGNGESCGGGAEARGAVVIND